MKLPVITQPVNDCGGCIECCQALGVQELNKPPQCRCQHQTENSCKIYGSHPKECKDYYCLWAMGALGSDEKYRPDKCGIVFSFDGFQKAPNDPITHTISIYIAQKSKLKLDEIRRLADMIKQKYPQISMLQFYLEGIFSGAPFKIKEPYPKEQSNTHAKLIPRGDKEVYCVGCTDEKMMPQMAMELWNKHFNACK